MCKWMKTGMITVLIVGGTGLALLGTESFSYARSAVGRVRRMVKGQVPIEFEIARARDLLDDIEPEIHRNVRLIAREEIEVEALTRELAEHQVRLDDARQKIARLRGMLGSGKQAYVLGKYTYDRARLHAELERRFERFKEAETAYQAKQKLLAARQQSLIAAGQMLDQARSRKAMLASRIEALEGQFRLVKAASAGSGVMVDHSKLAQTEQLMKQIKKRLDVAERMLAHESKFASGIDLDSKSEGELLSEVDSYFQQDQPVMRQANLQTELESPAELN